MANESYEDTCHVKRNRKVRGSFLSLDQTKKQFGRGEKEKKETRKKKKRKRKGEKEKIGRKKRKDKKTKEIKKNLCMGKGKKKKEKGERRAGCALSGFRYFDGWKLIGQELRLVYSPRATNRY